MEKIKVKHLTKVFGPRPERALALLEQGTDKKEIFDRTGIAVGIADVSFAMEEGEILVVMGLSGCGKSTLLRCINRLTEATRGKVIVDGVDIAELDSHQLRELRRTKFGMVFQNFALFPHRNVLANVAYGLEIQGLDQNQRMEQARQSLKLVGLEGWENAMPAQLSGGMQQRVGLARALALDPDILLMDEAFSALDPLIRRDMQDELLALQSRVHKTILFISHDLDEALKIGDRIVLMKDGQVVQIGHPEEILTTPASDYVERFVEDVNKSRVLSARSVMVRARAVAYPDDGPRTALHRMGEEGLSSLVVVERDGTVLGLVRDDALHRLAGQDQRNIEGIIDHDLCTVGPGEPLADLIPLLAEGPVPIAVVDDQHKLLGIIVKSTVLAALAERGEQSGNDHPANPA